MKLNLLRLFSHIFHQFTGDVTFSTEALKLVPENVSVTYVTLVP